MKVVSVVGLKKTGKTTLVSALVASLRRYGKVGAIKNMAGHPADHGDTHRHFEAGADVVIGLGQEQLTITRGGDLQSALEDLQRRGMDFVVVEGFKSSSLPKIVLGEVEVENEVFRMEISELDEGLVEELTAMVLGMGEWKQSGG